MEDIFESAEITLLIVREAMVYKIPPRVGAAGYKCADWKPTDHIWSGRLRVTSQGKKGFIKLEDASSGEIFAQCAIPAADEPQTIERATDSSRYFVLRIDDGSGRSAFIGTRIYTLFSFFFF
jgi:hypothetical protein